MLTAPIHVIVTARSKTETAQVDVNGKKQVQKLGMKTEQREGIEYEFTTVLDIIHDGHFATPSKDRTGIFNSSDPIVLSKEVGERIKKWLDSGVELKTPPKSESQNNSELSTQQNMSSTQTNTQIKKSFNEIVNERLDKCKSKDELESLYDQFLKWVEDKHPDKVDEFNIMYNDKVLSFM